MSLRYSSNINGGIKMELFEVILETYDGDIIEVDKQTFLEDAVLVAKAIPVEEYKTITIFQVDPYGKVEKVFNKEGEEI